MIKIRPSRRAHTFYPFYNNRRTRRRLLTITETCLNCSVPNYFHLLLLFSKQLNDNDNVIVIVIVNRWVCNRRPRRQQRSAGWRQDATLRPRAFMSNGTASTFDRGLLHFVLFVARLQPSIGLYYMLLLLRFYIGLCPYTYYIYRIDNTQSDLDE